MYYKHQEHLLWPLSGRMLFSIHPLICGSELLLYNKNLCWKHQYSFSTLLGSFILLVTSDHAKKERTKLSLLLLNSLQKGCCSLTEEGNWQKKYLLRLSWTQCWSRTKRSFIIARNVPLCFFFHNCIDYHFHISKQ